jgi:hypothetical protein
MASPFAQEAKPREDRCVEDSRNVFVRSGEEKVKKIQALVLSSYVHTRTSLQVDSNIALLPLYNQLNDTPLPSYKLKTWSRPMRHLTDALICSIVRGRRSGGLPVFP